MKTLLSRKNLKLASALFGTIVSLFSVFSATYAWFASVRMQSLNMNSFQITAGEEVQVSEYKIYGWDYDSDSPEISSTMMLNPYDAFIPTRNVNNHKYLRADLVFPDGLTANSSLNVSITATGVLATEEDNTVLAGYISNLIQFKYLINHEEDGDYLIDTASTESIYDSCAIEFAKSQYSSTLNKFVTIENEEELVISNGASKELTIVKQVITFPTAIAAGEHRELFIEYDYNDELIKYFEDHNGGSSDIERFEGEEVTFEADIATIKFGVTH